MNLPTSTPAPHPLKGPLAAFFVVSCEVELLEKQAEQQKALDSAKDTVLLGG